MKNSNMIRSLFAAILVCTLAAPVRAGLMEAILTALDQTEQASGPALFVGPPPDSKVPWSMPWRMPCEPNSVPGDFSTGPSILYDPVTGSVTALVPAAVLRVKGDPDFYWNDYKVAEVVFAPQLIGNALVSYSSTVFSWIGGFAETTPVGALSTAGGFVTWQQPPVQDLTFQTTRYPSVAAVLRFEGALPSGLTVPELTQLAASSPDANYVDYVNHRGIVTQHVPFSLGIIPEPSNLIGAFIAALAIALYGRLWRVRVAP